MGKCCNEELYEAVRDLIVFVIDSENIVNINEILSLNEKYGSCSKEIKELATDINDKINITKETIEIKLQDIEKRIDNEILILNERIDSLELKGGEEDGEEQNS